MDAPIRVKRDLNIQNKFNVNLIKAPINVKREEKVQKTDVVYNPNINIVEAPDTVIKIEKTKKKPVSIYDAIMNNKNEHDLFSDNYKDVLTVLQNEYIPKVKITKQEELRIEKENQNKLSKLMDLYRSI